MRASEFITEDFRILGQPAEIANTLPAVKIAKLAGQAGFYSVKSYLDDLKKKNPTAWEKAMRDGAPDTMDDWKKPMRLPSDTGVDPKNQYNKSTPISEAVKQRLDPKCWKGKHKEGTKIKGGIRVNNCVPNESVAEDWNSVNKKDKTDGLSQKAVNAYRRENPGSKLKTAVTTKPSKLKAGSKDAKRRKSFCARMSGNKGPMKKPNGKPTPKALALRRWNCESVEEMVDMIIENMDHSKDNQAVPELKAALLAKKVTLQNASEDDVYDIIDKIMTRIAKSHGISGQKLHDMWVKEYDQIPDTWIMK
jgi:hypothetical protein